MLPQARRRIEELAGQDGQVLHVGAAPPARADWVLAGHPWEQRPPADGHERFTRRTWLVRDVCARDPWPFADARFDLAVCTGLAALRDPVGVCRELSRVAGGGYVEVPTVEAELSAGVEGEWLGHAAHRWLCDVVEGSLVFTHKPHALHADPRVAVAERWRQRLAPEELVHGLFWQGSLPARERHVELDVLLDELAGRLRRRFEPTTAEVALGQARRGVRWASDLAARPARALVDRGLDALRGR